jgi:hypothetical protein
LTDDDQIIDIVIEALRAEIQSGDQILKQRMRELEAQITELRERVAVLLNAAPAPHLK